MADPAELPDYTGWNGGPSGRGTFDIVWNSILTDFLCSWTVLCLNLPPPGFGEIRWVRQKLLMAVLVFIGPEFLFQLALGQWLSARRSLAQFTASDLLGWTMEHAFFADMGGFVLDSAGFTVFPLTARQVHYLVTRGYVDMKEVAVDKNIIADRNKGDGITRLITVCQIIWFFMNSMARLCQRLSISTLELTTLANIFCTLATYFFWRHKPLDVKTPVLLRPKVPIAEILRKAGDAAKEPYKLTPLDFANREDFSGWTSASWTLYWTYWMGILGYFKIDFKKKDRPIRKISDDTYLPVYGNSLFFLFVFQTTFAAIHVAGWNLYFPTEIERTLWHGASLICIAAMLGYWAADAYTFQTLPYIYKRCPGVLFRKEHLKAHIRRCAPRAFDFVQRKGARLRNNHYERDHEFDVPLKALFPVTIVGAVYCFARGYIILDSFVNLRQLPATAYQTVDWTGFIPHF